MSERYFKYEKIYNVKELQDFFISEQFPSLKVPEVEPPKPGEVKVDTLRKVLRSYLGSMEDHFNSLDNLMEKTADQGKAARYLQKLNLIDSKLSSHL